MVCLPNSNGRAVAILQGETSLRGRGWGREKEGGGGEENKNEQRLIVHKSSHSIVSGEPPAALADVVPMNRSKHAHPLNFHCPSSHTGWDATSMWGLAHSDRSDTSHHYNHDQNSKQKPSWKWKSLALPVPICSEIEEEWLCFGE